MLCLCRTLLAAVAVSCTLSHGQSTQQLDRIKDLMCVLLLSGMQKEDLDVNLLNKLQRHNVNIHDLNNIELLHECTPFQSKIKPQLHTTEITNINIKKDIPKGKNQDTDKKNNITNFNPEQFQNFNEKTLRKEKNDKDAIQYIDGQPDIQSVLKFWQDIKINKTMRITESPIKLNAAYQEVDNIRTDQKNKRNVPDNSNSNESDIIQKILLNFFLKNEKKNLNEPLTEKNINNSDLYNDKYFLERQNERKTTGFNEDDKTENIPPITVKALQSKQHDLNNIYGNTDLNYKTLDRDLKSKNIGPENPNNFIDLLNVLQTFKTYYPPNNKNSEKNYQNNKEIIPSSDFINFPKNEKSSISSEKIRNPIIEEQKISQNVIKEIAKSVKELVLKDIRKEIFQTTNHPPIVKTTYTLPTTIQREEIISTIKRSNQTVEQSILNKFMDLFEEIKSLNHKTMIISSEIRKENGIKVESNMKKIYPVIPPGIIGKESSIDSRIKLINSNPQKVYDFSPQKHKFRSNGALESIKPVPIKATWPITVQTNNIEIPPLGIPVDKYDNPINQNIIVPTMVPYRIGEYKVDYNKINVPDSRIPEYVPKLSPIRFLKNQDPTPYYSNHPYGQRLALTNERNIHNTNLNDKVNLNKYKQTAHRPDVVKRPEIPRFHEKLEKGIDYFDIPENKEYRSRIDCCDERYAYSKQMVDCCNRKIASRQQMSLSNVKKQPSYDDTHFKNFLKSQQKVTDMLERILASRGRVRSVETA